MMSIDQKFSTVIYQILRPFSAIHYKNISCHLHVSYENGTYRAYVTLCILEATKRVLLQTVKTQMKCRILRHFIRVYTVC